MAHGTSYVHCFTSIGQMSCALKKGIGDSTIRALSDKEVDDAANYPKVDS
jgi:hypothetical protein